MVDIERVLPSGFTNAPGERIRWHAAHDAAHVAMHAYEIETLKKVSEMP
jgi:hypothetical protein